MKSTSSPFACLSCGYKIIGEWNYCPACSEEIEWDIYEPSAVEKEYTPFYCVTHDDGCLVPGKHHTLPFPEKYVCGGPYKNCPCDF
jgi:hypothetical protein